MSKAAIQSIDFSIKKTPSWLAQQDKKRISTPKPKPKTVPKWYSGLEPENETIPIAKEMLELENKYEKINDKSVKDVE